MSNVPHLLNGIDGFSRCASPLGPSTGVSELGDPSRFLEVSAR